MSEKFFRAGWAKIVVLVALIGLAVPLAAPGNALPAASAAFSEDDWTLSTFDAEGVTSAGSVTQDGSKITFSTNGWNVWGGADGFSFVSQPVEALYGECSTVTISGTINSIDGVTNVNAAAGLMFRDSLTADSKNVMLRMQNGSLLLTYRTADGMDTAYKRGATLTLPVEVKLVRQGSTFTGYYKQNGQWILSNFINVDMDTEMYGGIAGYSTNADPITVEYENVDIAGVDRYTPPDDDYVDPEPVGDDLLLRDRFEDGSATNGPETAINPVWRGVTTACIDQDAEGNRSWLRGGANGVAFAGDKTWTDYEASLDVQFEPGSTGKNTAEVLVRGRDTKLYGTFFYACGVTGGNKLVLEKAFMGGAVQVKSVDIPSVLDGQWHTIKAKALDNTMEIYLDGQLKLQYTDAQLPNLVGSVGIRTEDAAVKLDNVVVTKLDDPLGGDYDNEVGGGFDEPTPAD